MSKWSFLRSFSVLLLVLASLMLSLVAFGRQDFIHGVVTLRGGSTVTYSMTMGLMSSCRGRTTGGNVYNPTDSSISCSKVNPWWWIDTSPTYSTQQFWTTFQAFAIMEFIFKSCCFLIFNYCTQLEQMLPNRATSLKRMTIALFALTIAIGAVAVGLGFSAQGSFNSSSDFNSWNCSFTSECGDSMYLLAASFALSTVSIILYTLTQWYSNRTSKTVSDDFVASDVDGPLNSSINQSTNETNNSSSTSGNRLVPQQVAITINGEIFLATISPLVVPTIPTRPSMSNSQMIRLMQHAPSEYIPSHNPSAPVLLMDGEAMSAEMIQNSYPAIPHSPYPNEMSTS